MAERPIGRALTALGVFTARPAAYLIWLAYGAAWLVFDRESFDFHGGVEYAVWLMTLLIQRAEHRDTQALQAKLDELLRAHGHADNRLTRLDEKQAEEIEAHREQAQAKDPGTSG